MAEYSTTLASFFAASTSCGVIATGSGAAAFSGAANTLSPKRGRAFDDVASGKVSAASSRPSTFASCYRLSARQRSGGSVSHTSVPLGTAVSVDVMTRNVVPSDVSTM